MPKFSGFDVLSGLQRREIKTPVVVLTMLHQEEDIKRARELGAKEYFQKLPGFIDNVVKYAEKVSVL